MSIKIITTGGTIDDLDYDSLDKKPKYHKSLIPNLIKKTRVKVDYNIKELMPKDSRFVTDKDRELIFQECKKCKEDKITITHGTMSMPLTAKFLGKKKIRKTTLLTGAAIPANKENSDALFNIGAALAAVQILPIGVYIAMNGKIFSWDNVKKNLDTGYFEKEK